MKSTVSSRSRVRRSRLTPRRARRRMVFEPLEHRLVLAAPTLDTLYNVIVPAGTTLMVALNGHDGDNDALTFTAFSSTGPFTSTVMPSSNRSLRLNVQGFGAMELQLLENYAPNTTARIINFAQSGFYNHGTTVNDPMTFHRIVDGFMIQGGDPTGTGSGSSGVPTIGLEVHADLQYSSAGVMGMARTNNPNSNDSQFFITDDAATFLNNNYTIFGFLTKGQSVESAIASVPVEDNGFGEQSRPLTPVVISSAEVFSDTSNGVLLVKSPAGATGFSTITVTVNDGNGGTAERTFRVYTALSAPSAVTVTGGGSTLTNRNNSSGKPLQLTVANVMQGASVTLKDEAGRTLFSGTNYVRNGNNAEITTNASVTLADGARQITATQTLDGTTSAASPALTITVDTAAPQIASSGLVNVGLNGTLTYDVTTNAGAGETIAYSLTNAPAGATINPATGRVTWPNAAPAGDTTMTVTATDGAGNAGTKQVTVHVVDGIAPPSGVTITGGGALTNLNNSSAKPLQLTVLNVLVDAAVTVKDEAGRVLFSGTSYTRNGTSAEITTNAAVTLADGAHQITATQTKGGATSAASSPLTITVDTTAPQITSGGSVNVGVNGTLTYDATSNAAAGETVTYSLANAPGGATINAATGRVTWANAAPLGDTTMDVRATDGAGNVGTKQVTIHVLAINPAPVVNLPTTADGVRASVRRSGAQLQVINDDTDATIFAQALSELTSLTVVSVAGQPDQLTIAFDDGGVFTLSGGLTYRGGASGTLVVHGTTGADSIELAGGTVIANGLTTTLTQVQEVWLEGDAGNDVYKLTSSAIPVVVAETAGSDALDFSAAGGGVSVSLALNAGQPQSITPWGTTLALTGAFESLTGTAFADSLSGGDAAAAIVRGLGGNDVLRAGRAGGVLLGGAGADTLYGGLRSNLLIGGGGADTLRGGKGSNTLIGGSTSHDANDQALLTLLNKGSLAGSKPSRRHFLGRNTSVGGNALLKVGVNVQDDGLRNALYGGGAYDWFLPGKKDAVKQK